MVCYQPDKGCVTFGSGFVITQTKAVSLLVRGLLSSRQRLCNLWFRVCYHPDKGCVTFGSGLCYSWFGVCYHPDKGCVTLGSGCVITQTKAVSLFGSGCVITQTKAVSLLVRGLLSPRQRLCHSWFGVCYHPDKGCVTLWFIQVCYGHPDKGCITFGSGFVITQTKAV